MLPKSPEILFLNFLKFLIRFCLDTFERDHVVPVGFCNIFDESENG